MKPSKLTIVYLAAMIVTILFDLTIVGILTWVLMGKINGTMLVPEWFFPLCISGAAINGAFFVFTVVWVFVKKR